MAVIQPTLHYFPASVDVVVCFSLPFYCFLILQINADNLAHSTDEGIICPSAPGIRVIAWTPRSHFKILFNSITRAASAS